MSITTKATALQPGDVYRWASGRRPEVLRRVVSVSNLVVGSGAFVQLVVENVRTGARGKASLAASVEVEVMEHLAGDRLHAHIEDFEEGEAVMVIRSGGKLWI